MDQLILAENGQVAATLKIKAGANEMIVEAKKDKDTIAKLARKYEETGTENIKAWKEHLAKNSK